MPLSESEMAQNYGFALAFLKSDKGLWKLFNSAVDGNWAPDRFIAKLKNTKWYKTHSDSSRQYELLKASDPATFKQKQAQLKAQIGDAAASLGAVVNAKTLNTIVNNAMQFGYNDSQIRNILADYVKVSNGVYRGSTGNDIEAVRQTAYKNGIRLSKATEQEWAQKIARGYQDADFFNRQVRQMAKSLAPGYAQELDGGMDLQDIVSPYMQAKAKILEMNPADIDLFDEDIRQTLSGKTKDGKPATTTLWQFEQQMRQKPQWLKTQNAQDSTMAVAKKVLSDFGFQGVG